MTSRRSCLALLLLAASAFSQDTFEGVGRIVAIGDVHGDYDRFTGLLRTAGLTGPKSAWRGGTAHLVVVGDYTDRGPASRRVMDLLMELEQRAEKAGGRVHALLGNHEVMNIIGDLRYVSQEDFRSFRTSSSERLREELLELTLRDLKAKGAPPPDEQQFREEFEASRPLGYVEHRLAFAPNGKYGKWLRQRSIAVRINDYFFVHGGISPQYVTFSRKELNARAREELADPAKFQRGMLTDENGPLWYRGLVQSPENAEGLEAHVRRVLETQEAKHIVVGHTPTATILPRFGGRVIPVDVGLSQFYKGTPAFLLVEGPRAYNVNAKGRVAVPLEGGDLLEYLRNVQQIDSSNSRLNELIQKTGG